MDEKSVRRERWLGPRVDRDRRLDQGRRWEKETGQKMAQAAWPHRQVVMIYG